jgi:hypothetical protein
VQDSLIAGVGLDGVGQGMSEVQQSTKPTLSFITSDDTGMCEMIIDSEEPATDRAERRNTYVWV